MSVVCCQVEIPAMGWLLVQRIPTDCGVSECDRKISTPRKPWPTRGCCVMGKKCERLLIKAETGTFYCSIFLQYSVRSRNVVTVTSKSYIHLHNTQLYTIHMNKCECLRARPCVLVILQNAELCLYTVKGMEKINQCFMRVSNEALWNKPTVLSASYTM